MNFPLNYSYGLDEVQMSGYFPNSQIGQNYDYTSLKTFKYNCIAYVLGIFHTWVQFNDNFGDGMTDADLYVEYFKFHGFILSESNIFDPGKYKIAVYIDSKVVPNEFKHVACLLPNGKWSSKLGKAEDIEHENPETLAGWFYGSTIIIMERNI